MVSRAQQGISQAYMYVGFGSRQPMISQSQKRISQPESWALWEAGFRPFFLGAALWSIVTMAIWFGVLILGWQFPFNSQAPATWHAHEMIFGYSVAIVAGFLLTAVPNWTETKPIGGLPLIVVLFTWLGARVTGLGDGAKLLYFTACLDLLFTLSLFTCVALPILRERRFKQVGVLAKVILLGVANGAYYLGASGNLENGVTIGLYTGFYLIIALILTVGRRVIPFFIERRLDLSEPIRNYEWLDRASLLLFLLFWILQVSDYQKQWVPITALLLFLLHAVRLYHWYRPGIWAHPLLWVLITSYGFIVLSFALVSASLFGLNYSPFLTLHLFAVGGIGLITCGMMARISLGHTGRDVSNPPKLIVLTFAFIILAAIVRAVLPAFFANQYLLWIGVSQWLWIFGFTIFVIQYTSILLFPGIDGQRG